jgi:hypothetical protein
MSRLPARVKHSRLLHFFIYLINCGGAPEEGNQIISVMNDDRDDNFKFSLCNVGFPSAHSSSFWLIAELIMRFSRS